jgi:hypothetical protein
VELTGAQPCSPDLTIDRRSVTRLRLRINVLKGHAFASGSGQAACGGISAAAGRSESNDGEV